MSVIPAGYVRKLLPGEDVPEGWAIDPFVERRARMTLAEVQAAVRPWQERNFPDRQPWEPLLGVVEEVGEAAHSFLKRHQRIRLNEDHAAKLRDALGDALVYLCDFANGEGVDLEEVLAEVWAEVGSRDWVAHRETYGIPARGGD